MNSDDLELGPVDIVVIGFPPDAPRTGEAIPIFVDLVDRGIIRVLDVLMVQKDADGIVSGLEIADLDGDGYTDLAVFEGARTGMLGDEDADVAGEALEPGETAVLICFENTWAAPFVPPCAATGVGCSHFQRVPAQEHRLTRRSPRRRIGGISKREGIECHYFDVLPVAAVGAVPAASRGRSAIVSRAGGRRRNSSRWPNSSPSRWRRRRRAEEDPMAKLKELGQLHESGVLTDEEFAAAKAKILNA